MNTVTEWKTTAQVTDPDRQAFWRKVFESDRIPIVSILPQIVNLPNNPKALVYMLDLHAIIPEQRERLVQAIAEKFNAPIEEVEANLDDGLPVLAEHVMVSSSDPGVLFSFSDDELFGDFDDFQREGYEDEYDDEEY